MKETKTQLGQRGEELALEFLKKQGFKIVEKNYRIRSGEIDIIAQDQGTICFVEVRARAKNYQVHPFETINKTKKSRIAGAALNYLQKNNLLNSAARFDVVSVIPQDHGDYEIQIIKNAFEVD